MDEDPSEWGRGRTLAAGGPRDALVRDTPPSGWGHPTVSEPPAGERPMVDRRPVGPTSVAGDASAASYVPPRRDADVIERDRLGALPAVDAEAPVDRPTFSVAATFLGWAVAAFFTVIFAAVAITLAGGTDIQDGAIDLGGLAVASLIGYLIASFLAYLVGGYTAGRISLWNGTWHGLGTVVWAVLFAVLGVLAGVYLADTFDFGMRVDVSGGLTGAGILAIGLSLLAMLAGAALGGRLGERYHETTRRASVRERELRGTRRGRPL